MEYAIVGWPGDEATLDLDHRQFAYAGKFVMSRSGKAVARAAGEIVGAAAFDSDRTDKSVCRVRYFTVRSDRQRAGIGAKLLDFVATQAVDRGYETVKIAVNNPYAYVAAYRAGFEYTGEQTGIAELVLERPSPASPEAYARGLRVFLNRDEPATLREFVRERLGEQPPDRVHVDSSHLR